MDATLLDTDILSEVIKLRNLPVRQKALSYVQLAFSSMTRYEILRGYHDQNATTQLARFTVFCQHSMILAVTDAIFDRAAELWVIGRRGGYPHNDADLLIAATALEHSRTLVTGIRPTLPGSPAFRSTIGGSRRACPLDGEPSRSFSVRTLPPPEGTLARMREATVRRFSKQRNGNRIADVEAGLHAAITGARGGRWTHWLLTTHVGRYLRHDHSSGHIWQARFKAFAIQEDDHLRTVLRDVMRDPLHANLVERAADWPWSSLHPARSGPPLVTGSAPCGADWVEFVNQAMNDGELASLRESIHRDRPFGAESWTREVAERLQPEPPWPSSKSTGNGRPSKA